MKPFPEPTILHFLGGPPGKPRVLYSLVLASCVVGKAELKLASPSRMGQPCRQQTHLAATGTRFERPCLQSISGTDQVRPATWVTREPCYYHKRAFIQRRSRGKSDPEGSSGDRTGHGKVHFPAASSNLLKLT